jgi:hypothetical protein
MTAIPAKQLSRMLRSLRQTARIALCLPPFLLLQPDRAVAIDVATPVSYTALLMAVEFAAINILDLNHRSISYDNFERTINNPSPREDDDSDFINYVLHPLMGSETYLRAREGDFGIPGSIGFSLAASVTWEYAVESWTEHPSTKDIFVTTGVGWLIGELRYQLKQYAIDNDLSYVLVDPIWAALEYFDVSITKRGSEVTTLFGVTFPL